MGEGEVKTCGREWLARGGRDKTGGGELKHGGRES